MSTPDRPDERRPDSSFPLPPDPFPMGMAGWVPGSAGRPRHPVLEKGQDVALTTDDVLHCREQAIYTAALLIDMGPFPDDDDVTKVVVLAQRFERYIRTGE